MLKIVLASILLSPPASAVEWAPPTAGEWAAVGVDAVLTTIDMLQTSDCLYHVNGSIRGGVPYFCHELNPLFGKHPSRARLWGTSGAGLVLTTAAFYVLPPRWRIIVPATASAVHVGFIIHNASVGLSAACQF